MACRDVPLAEDETMTCKHCAKPPVAPDADGSQDQISARQWADADLRRRGWTCARCGAVATKLFRGKLCTSCSSDDK